MRVLSPTMAVFPVLCFLSIAQAAPPEAEFTLGPDAVNQDTGRLRGAFREGYLTLSWSAHEDDVVFDLQSDSSASFTEPVPRYAGRDAKSFISGLEQGDHFFRVRARRGASEQWGRWSAPVIVPVRHHSLAVAWWLFGTGAVLFGLTVAFIAIHAKVALPPEAMDE